MRGILSQNWVEYLPKVVQQFNHTPQTKLGNIAPEQILSLADSARVFDARKKSHVTVFHEPNFKQQLENQLRYEKNNSNLQVGDFVFLTLDEKLFDKSFDVKVKKFITFLTRLYCLTIKSQIDFFLSYEYLLRKIMKKILLKTNNKLENRLYFRAADVKQNLNI